jgi:hypothetical protein
LDKSTVEKEWEMVHLHLGQIKVFEKLLHVPTQGRGSLKIEKVGSKNTVGNTRTQRVLERSEGYVV